MTIAFIISAVIAGILFFLLISKRDELKKAEDQTERLNSRLQEMMKESNATKDFRLQAILEIMGLFRIVEMMDGYTLRNRVKHI